MIKLCFFLFGAYYISSIIINLIILLFSQSETSANQLEVMKEISVSPYLTMFSTLIYAPIVEELVFRGVFIERYALAFRVFRPL